MFAGEPSLFCGDGINIGPLADVNKAHRCVRHTMVKVTVVCTVHCNAVAIRFHRDGHVEVGLLLDRTTAKPFLDPPVTELDGVTNDDTVPGSNAYMQRRIIAWVSVWSGLQIYVEPEIIYIRPWANGMERRAALPLLLTGHESSVRES